MAETVQQYMARIAGYVEGRDTFEVIEETPAKLRELMASASKNAVDFRTAPGKWSIREQVAHLADVEMMVSARIRWAAAEPGTSIVAFDQDKWAITGKYASTPVELSLATFLALRSWTIDFLKRLTPAERAGHIVHQERGKETIERLLIMLSGHDLNHLRQISELVTAAGKR